MAYSPTEVNKKYWRELTEAASDSLQKKMHFLDDADGFRRDDSFLGNKAPNHMMYKLESLFSKDGHREYEFLIEYDIWKPTVGIYYGCKGLIHDGELDKEIAKFNDEWAEIQNEVLYVLNNTFPEKDFSKRFKPTNNANDNTYWPFWISLYEDEDIKEVAARATKIIRNIYQKFINGYVFKKRKIRIKQLETETKTAFTNAAYKDFKSSLKTNDNIKAFEKLMNHLSAIKLVERNDTYENCWTMKMSNTQFAFLWATFCKHFDIYEKGRRIPWQYVITIFVNKKGVPLSEHIRKQYSQDNLSTNDKNKKKRAEAIIKELFE